MDTSMPPATGDDRSTMLLDKIAAALDCPVSAFSSHPLVDRVQTTELLRMWFLLERDQDRAAVLAFIETAVETQSLNTAAE